MDKGKKRQRHPKKDDDLLFYCRHCSKKYKTAQGYMRHQQKKHGGAVKKLPRRKRATIAVKTKVANTECKICLDTLAQPAGVALPCGHGCFCFACIDDPYSAGTLPTCPMCRAPIQSVNKLYI